MLISWIQVLRRPSTSPVTVEAENESSRIAEAIILESSLAEKAFEAPGNWKVVKDRLTETLAQILHEHLPNTLERLWCEIALNLTTAPWLFPDKPCFGVNVRRGEQRASLRVKDRLARYILNQSEIHILGLAWFFVRYLTYGRFFHALMVMDDPAQELDQTSFRELCRLFETWVRLHRVATHPLTFLVLLGQEGRALDAARAIGGTLGVLNWNGTQTEGLREVNVIGPGFHAPQPTKLFGLAV